MGGQRGEVTVIMTADIEFGNEGETGSFKVVGCLSQVGEIECLVPVSRPTACVLYSGEYELFCPDIL